jgi:hypothetical protein
VQLEDSIKATKQHIVGEIWELKPINNRILYAAWDGNSFILLVSQTFLHLNNKTAKYNKYPHRKTVCFNRQKEAAA